MKYLMDGPFRIGTWSEMRGWYILTVPGTATYYDRSARVWVVFAIDYTGQQDGDAQYTAHKYSIRRIARMVTRW